MSNSPQKPTYPAKIAVARAIMHHRGIQGDTIEVDAAGDVEVSRGVEIGYWALWVSDEPVDYLDVSNFRSAAELANYLSGYVEGEFDETPNVRGFQ